jgi:hypothetical protein
MDSVHPEGEFRLAWCDALCLRYNFACVALSFAYRCSPHHLILCGIVPVDSFHAGIDSFHLVPQGKIHGIPFVPQVRELKLRVSDLRFDRLCLRDIVVEDPVGGIGKYDRGIDLFPGGSDAFCPRKCVDGI